MKSPKPQVDPANSTKPVHLEEKRLALEFENVKLERQKARVELLLKRRELNAAKNKGWKDILANPLTLAIVGGFITLMTTTIAGHFNASENIDAETTKAREALQADLIKKFVENPNPQTVRANLRFLVDVGLVPSYAEGLKTFLDKNPDSALPSSFTLGPSRLENVRTDDDAIDLVIQAEGGFYHSDADPSTATNHGISLGLLSLYLGKSASIDDLRNLSVEMTRDIYKKQYLSGAPSDITSARVKAAYLSLATLSGEGRAGIFFRSAINKIDKVPLSAQGGIDAATVQRINAIDPDLLIEAVNCEAFNFYKSLPTFSTFGRMWIGRLSKFSPATLKGLCAELQPASTARPSNP